MLKDWQFNILFFVAVGGALLALVGPEFGLEVGQNPTALTGVGAILTYILTQKRFTKHSDKKPEEPETPSEPKEGSDDGS